MRRRFVTYEFDTRVGERRVLLSEEDSFSWRRSRMAFARTALRNKSRYQLPVRHLPVASWMAIF